jgi:FkbM family methyltransferase
VSLIGAAPVQYAEREGLVALLETDLIPDRSLAIDGGSHVGTWAELMSAAFETVHAFEPSEAFESLAINAAAWPNVICHNEALIDECCAVETFSRKKIGKLTSRMVRKIPKGKLRGRTIDSLDLQACGLIKLDVEGSEYAALTGARQTIARFRPFLLVEMFGRGVMHGHTDEEVRDLVLSMGYQMAWKYNVDVGFLPIERGNG